MVANRCDPREMAAVPDALRTASRASTVYVLPEEPLLVAPTVGDLSRSVHGTLVSGDESLLTREAMRRAGGRDDLPTTFWNG